MNIDYQEGKFYLDMFLALPRRSQELLFSLFTMDLFQEDKKGMDILDTIMNCNGGCISYENCKSPIEEIFALAFDIVIAEKGFPYNEIFALYPQYEIKTDEATYIADFVLDTEMVKGIRRDHPLKLVIECDGHDFHEKTKKQVEYGNQRNLDLQMAGYEVLHFSGSQIYKDPIKCAKDAYSYIRQKVGKVYINW